jgi:hypothetical protein
MESSQSIIQEHAALSLPGRHGQAQGPIRLWLAMSPRDGGFNQRVDWDNHRTIQIPGQQIHNGSGRSDFCFFWADPAAKLL